MLNKVDGSTKLTYIAIINKNDKKGTHNKI